MSLAWEITKFALPLVISIATFWIVVFDRRPRLILRSRKGLWSMLSPMHTVRGTEVTFAGIIEVYNPSSRSNSIRNYQVSVLSFDKTWLDMESEYVTYDSHDGTGSHVYNQSPLSLPPYSGIEVRVFGVGQVDNLEKAMHVRIVLEDLFEKRYELSLISYS